MTRNVRRSYARDKLRQSIKRQGLPCHICGLPIDYSLPAGHPMSYELDELVPVSRLPYEQRKAAACDPSNVAPAHRRCNQRKGNRMATDAGLNAAKAAPIAHSRQW